eukprot:scaffold40294_cov39-Phaeocystis_antarctica.AAC.1
MGAHAIIARVGGDGMKVPTSLWHVHFSVPKGFAQLGGGNGAAACVAAMPGMGGVDASAPAAAFGPSLVGTDPNFNPNFKPSPNPDANPNPNPNLSPSPNQLRWVRGWSISRASTRSTS